MIVRDSALIARPGYEALTTSAPFTNAGIGGIYYTDNALSAKMFAASLTKIKEFDGTNWTDRTGTDLTGDEDDQGRMALFQTSTTSTVLFTNNQDTPRKLVSGSTSANLGGLGAIQAARDVTVCFQRAILGNVILSGTRAPSTLMISDKDNPESWPAANQVDLSDTNDTIVAVRVLNNQMFAVYKDFSVWVGIGAPNVYPFTFEMKGSVPGPVSPSSVVAAYGKHYYLGQDGIPYSFDGQTVQPIGTSIAAALQGEINFLKGPRVHGFFDRFNSEIWWFYVSTGSSSDHPNAGICYSLLDGAWSAPLRFTHNLAASWEWKANTTFGWDDLSSYTWDDVGGTYPTWNSFPQQSQLLSIVVDSAGTAYKFGGAAQDAGSDFAAHFTLPTRDYAGAGQKVRVDAVESYWGQTSDSRTMQTTLYLTSTLADSGTAQAAQSFDLNNAADQKVAEYSGAEGRFAAVRFNLPNAHGLDEFRGMTIYYYRRSEPTGN